MKLVTIIIPVYNAAEFLSQSLGSVARQTYKNWELVAVDDCSNDESVRILEDFKKQNPQKVTLLTSSKPRSGASVCRNIGWKLSKGEFIIFLDSDDLLEPFCLQQRVAAMKDLKTDWAVFNQYGWYPPQPPAGHYNKDIKSKEEAIQYFLQMDSAWQTMAVIWKRATLEKLQGFDETLYFMEDPDLHLRALLKNDLSVSFKRNLPADCFYRMPVITELNAESFYNNSIKSRFKFLEKIMKSLPVNAQPQILPVYYKHIRFGFFDFVKVLLLKRINAFENEFATVVRLLKSKGVLSNADVSKMKLVQKIFASNSRIVTLFKIKGLTRSFLFH